MGIVLKMKRKNKFTILFLICFILILQACSFRRTSLSSYEQKIYDSLKIAKSEIKNFNKSYIENIYNLIDDAENFVLIKISGKWYVLAIDNYELASAKNIKYNTPKGLAITLKAKKGDIAEAVDILADMAEAGINKHLSEGLNTAIDLNEAFGLKQKKY